MARASAACAWIVMTACTTRQLVVEPAAIEAASSELRAGHRATVQTIDNDDVTLDRDQQVTVVDTTGEAIPMKLGVIVDDCPDHPTEAHRLCKLAHVDQVVTGHRRVSWITAPELVGAAVIVGPVVCAFECASPWNKIVPIGAGIGVATLLVIGIYVVVKTVSLR